MKWNQFVQGDAFEIMPEMEDGSVDFLFTSPPDISQTEFEKDIESFKSFQQRFLEQFSRLVKDNGFILICQTDRKINAEILSNHITYCNGLSGLGWKLKDYKIIVRNHPVDKKDMYYFNYQHCLIFTKTGTIKRGGEFLRNILVYDTKRMGSSKGPFNFYVWPEAFCKLMIEYLSKENEGVFDPFAGSGIVPYVARNMNRKYLGIELKEDLFDASIMKTKTLSEFFDGV